jgi:membrane protein/epoxyqueuosine reductase
MANVSNTGTPTGAPIAADKATETVEPASRSKWYRWRKDGKALVQYLLDSEVHTFAFSVAANAILSFIPFIVLLYTLAVSVFHSHAMVGVINDMVHYYLPSTTSQDYLTSNLEAVVPRHGAQVFSVIMILISCTGIFLPLEVALNQAWGVTKSRNYLANQVVAFGLAILMVVLGMGSILVNAGARDVLAVAFLHNTEDGMMGLAFHSITSVVLAATTGIASILFFFSIYWVLPNRKVPAKPVMRTAIITGLIWLAAKYVFVAFLPHMDLKALYGPFFVSVGLIFWAYVSGLILFAGAQFSVARWGAKES